MKFAIVNDYKPAVRYRFFNRYHNGITIWVRLFKGGVSVALHAFTPDGEGKHADVP